MSDWLKERQDALNAQVERLCGLQAKLREEGLETALDRTRLERVTSEVGTYLKAAAVNPERWQLCLTKLGLDAPSASVPIQVGAYLRVNCQPRVDYQLDLLFRLLRARVAHVKVMKDPGMPPYPTGASYPQIERWEREYASMSYSLLETLAYEACVRTTETERLLNWIIPALEERVAAELDVQPLSNPYDLENSIAAVSGAVFVTFGNWSPLRTAVEVLPFVSVASSLPLAPEPQSPVDAASRTWKEDVRRSQNDYSAALAAYSEARKSAWRKLTTDEISAISSRSSN